MGGPINPDPEQQRADNEASRRQSQFGPRVPDRREPGTEEAAERGEGTAARRGREDAAPPASDGG